MKNVSDFFLSKHFSLFVWVSPYFFFFFYSLVEIHISYPRFLWECTLSFTIVSSSHRNKRSSYWVLIRMENSSSVIMWPVGSEDKHMKHVTLVFHPLQPKHHVKLTAFWIFGQKIGLLLFPHPFWSCRGNDHLTGQFKTTSRVEQEK